MLKKLKEFLTPLLRKSERYTKTDMVYLAGGGFWLFLGYASQVVAGLVLAIAFANLLPKTAYGNYQFIISMSAIIGGFTLTGMGTALMRAVARGSTTTLIGALRTQLVWSVGIVVVAAGVSLYYYLNENALLAGAFLVVGATSPLLAGFSLYRPYLEGKQRFKESTTLGVWRRPIPLIAVVTALFLTDNVLVLVLTYFLSHTISMGLLFRAVVKKYPERSAPTDPEVVSYSKHLSIMGFVGLVANNLDHVIVFHYLGAAPVAAFALAQLPSTHLLKMFGLIGNLVFPKFAQRDFSTLKRTIHRKLWWYLLLVGTVALCYLLAAPLIFNVLFPAYPEAIALSQILILSLLAKPFTLYAQAFAAHGAKGTQHFIQITVAVVKLSLLIVLLPLFGLWGAVMALLTTNLYWVLILIVLFYTRKTPKEPEPTLATAS